MARHWPTLNRILVCDDVAGKRLELKLPASEMVLRSILTRRVGRPGPATGAHQLGLLTPGVEVSWEIERQRGPAIG